MSEEKPAPQQPMILSFRIDDVIPTIEMVGRPTGHKLKIWMNYPAAVELSHRLLEVATGMPRTPDAIAIMEWGGTKVPKGAELNIKTAPNAPVEASPVLNQNGEQILKTRG